MIWLLPDFTLSPLMPTNVIDGFSLAFFFLVQDSITPDSSTVNTIKQDNFPVIKFLFVGTALFFVVLQNKFLLKNNSKTNAVQHNQWK